MRRRRWRAKCAAPIRGHVVSRDFSRWRSCRRWPRSPVAARRRPASMLAPRASTADERPRGCRLHAARRRRRRRAGTRRIRARRSTSTPQSGGHPQFGGGGLTQLARAAQMWAAAGSLSLQEGGSRGPRCFNNNEPIGRPHLADLRRSVRRNRRRELDAGDRRRLLLVERRPQVNGRELLEDHQGHDRDRQRRAEVHRHVHRLLRGDSSRTRSATPSASATPATGRR